MEPLIDAPLIIDIISDVVSPWCFIGRRRLEKALALMSGRAAIVNWHPCFLNPWVPREGMSRGDYLRAKFGSMEDFERDAKHIAAAGAAEGIAFAFDKIQRQPNTLDCHRLLHWAKDKIDPSWLQERLMTLYFIEGADLSDTDVLVSAVVDCGMDGGEVRRLLATDADIEFIKGQAVSATAIATDGLPCFIFAGVTKISGVRSTEDLLYAMRLGHQERAQRTLSLSAAAANRGVP